jgi:hypothetical protein
MDDDFQKRIWEQIHKIWIEPEVEKRRSKGLITDEFKIRECRILFPKDESPKVEFNDEIA